MFGYLGSRGIFGSVVANGGAWSGTFRVAGTGEEIAFAGSARVPDADPDAPTPDASDGQKVHEYLVCSFKSASGGTVDEASCLHEGDTLEIQGEWQAGGKAEGFYLRTLGAGALDDAEYFGAALNVPTPPHACPPFIELLASSEHHERVTSAYRLRWPCDGDGAPSSVEAYVMDLEQAAPHRLLWSSPWSSLPDVDAPNNDVQLAFNVSKLTPRLELYVGRITDSFQSPNTGGHNSSERVSVWTTDGAGRYGKMLDLPASESGQGGFCISETTENDSWLLDLDGDKVPEIVVRSRVSGRQDHPDGKGDVECIDGPTSESYSAYHLDTKTLEWRKAPAPRGMTEARLSHGTQLGL